MKVGQRTFRELETGVEMDETEPSDSALWPGVLRSRDRDCGEEVPNDVTTCVLQLSTSPVALECTADDDSNGSIAHDRFNLGVSLVHSSSMQRVHGLVPQCGVNLSQGFVFHAHADSFVFLIVRCRVGVTTNAE